MAPAEARYDAVADFYAGWPDSADDAPARSLLELAGQVGGARVLDVACGHGRMARQLASRGARVTGVDISAALLARAEDAERRLLAWPAWPPPGTDRAWPRQLADRTTPTSRSADC